MDPQSEAEIGRRINAALAAIRDAIFRMGMSGRLHIAKAADMLEDHSLIERHVRSMTEHEEARYLTNLGRLIDLTKAQDAKCGEIWNSDSQGSQSRYETEHAKLQSLFLQFEFPLKSYERLVRQPDKPYLDQAKQLANESASHPSVKSLENRMRLRLRDFIELEASIDAKLAELDLARKELADAHRDLAIEYAGELHTVDPATIECATVAVQKAAEYFDYTRGYRFMTFAKPWIERAIERQQSQ